MATEDGYRRIDEIETGDLVWAYNVETGELELKEVLTVYVKENKEILHLETSIGNIDTTTNHPFYVIDEGWVAAGDLEIGDEVYTLDGSVSVITGFWLEVFDAPVTVYNLKVDGFHTYFVGEFGVLVHNACKGGRFKDVNDSKGECQVGHHMQQQANNKRIGRSSNDGPALLMDSEDHRQTRTYAGRGKGTMISDVGLTPRERLTLDVIDILIKFGTKYIEGLIEMLEYAETLPEYQK